MSVLWAKTTEAGVVNSLSEAIPAFLAYYEKYHCDGTGSPIVLEGDAVRDPKGRAGSTRPLVGLS